MGKRECFLEKGFTKLRISVNKRFETIKCIKHANGSKQIYERLKTIQQIQRKDPIKFNVATLEKKIKITALFFILKV